MNQDFTVQKKQYLSEKKKIRAEGFTWKKNSCTSIARKKKFVQAENSTIHTRTIFTYDFHTCRWDVVGLIYTTRSDVKVWRVLVAYDSRK